MTHDELLDRIAQEGLKPDGNVLNTRLVLALRAVVELHTPIYDNSCSDPDCCGGPYPDLCDDCGDNYPCPTIQAIEKELA